MRLVIEGLARFPRSPIRGEGGARFARPIKNLDLERLGGARSARPIMYLRTKVKVRTSLIRMCALVICDRYSIATGTRRISGLGSRSSLQSSPLHLLRMPSLASPQKYPALCQQANMELTIDSFHNYY